MYGREPPHRLDCRAPNIDMDESVQDEADSAGRIDHAITTLPAGPSVLMSASATRSPTLPMTAASSLEQGAEPHAETGLMILAELTGSAHAFRDAMTCLTVGSYTLPCVMFGLPIGQ